MVYISVVAIFFLVEKRDKIKTIKSIHISQYECVTFNFIKLFFFNLMHLIISWMLFFQQWIMERIQPFLEYLSNIYNFCSDYLLVSFSSKHNCNLFNSEVEEKLVFLSFPKPKYLGTWNATILVLSQLY